MKNKPTRVTWLIRAKRNRTHKDLGRTLAGRADETADDGMLHFEMKASDGTWTMWNCGDKSFDAAKSVVLDFLSEGKEVFLYQRLDDAMPTRFEDAEIGAARLKIVTPPITPKVLAKTLALKAAKKRLQELKRKRSIPAIH